MAAGQQQLSIAQMPRGLHVLTLRADWTSASGEHKFVRTAPLWFGQDMDFTTENVEQTALQHHAGDLLAQAQLWRCMMSHTHQLLPKLWISLSAAGAYQEALQYVQMAVGQVPSEPWFHLGYACAVFLSQGGADGGCAHESACYAGVVASFMQVLKLGMQSTTAQGGINEMVGISDSYTENDAGISLKAALLRGEIQWNRERFATPVVQYPLHHPCRNDAKPYKCVIIYARQYLEELSDPWGPAKLASGMGGANEAVVFLARDLAQVCSSPQASFAARIGLF